MTEHRLHVCACGHRIPYKLDRIADSAKRLRLFDHIDMFKHCPRCKREQPLGAIILKANETEVPQ